MNHDFELFVLRNLVDQGLIDDALADRAGGESSGARLAWLIEHGDVSEREVALALAAVCECPYVNLDEFEIDLSHATLLSRQVAEAHSTFPLFDMESCVTVVIADPLDLGALDTVRNAIGRRVEFVHAERAPIDALVKRAYALHPSRPASGPLRETAGVSEPDTSSGPVVAAVNEILGQAVKLNATDIHLGPDEHELLVRFRIDGSLRPMKGPGRSSHEPIVQRLKVMARLDLTQTRRPQDGKFRFTHNGQHYDIRLSLLPTVWGENVVMRVLSTARATASLTELGLFPETAQEVKDTLGRPHGVFLVTGPTGSGKTTTLYAALSLIDASAHNVVTIEDPVELHLPSIRQVQVNADIGLTFAGALRSVLRQDPDVVLVGEMRDAETARIGTQAALTGHLVLASLHTNDAPGAVTRLRDLEVPAFAISGSLLAVLAQRLVKRICPSCARPSEPDARLLERFALKNDVANGFVVGVGCRECMNTGVQGRVAITEFLPMCPDLRQLVQDGAAPDALRRVAIASGMTPMWQDGLRKARAGLTTLEEIARVVAIEDDAPSLPQLGAAA